MLERSQTASGYVGVAYRKSNKSNPFEAHIRQGGRQGKIKSLGHFATAEEAALAHARAKREKLVVGDASEAAWLMPALREHAAASTTLDVETGETQPPDIASESRTEATNLQSPPLASPVPDAVLEDRANAPCTETDTESKTMAALPALEPADELMLKLS
mmetsp:Transcript_41075/g.108537  ORF Transcript_41075/g.108537 Transcript_41075/m.108537 type:complete len:160 (+) Transcript_41075:701-1180(+)